MIWVKVNLLIISLLIVIRYKIWLILKEKYLQRYKWFIKLTSYEMNVLNETLNLFET
jgi:hypothetical protein